MMLSKIQRSTAASARTKIKRAVSKQNCFSRKTMKTSINSVAACFVFPLYSQVSFSASFSSVSFPLKDPTLLRPLLNDGDKSFDVFDPAAVNKSEGLIGKLKCMGRDETKKAIDLSSEALPSWRDGTTGLHRSNILRKWSALIQENKKDLATIMTLESGKPLHEAMGEVGYASSFVDFYAAEAVRPSSHGGGWMAPTPFTHLGESAPRGRVMALKEAIGVTAMITPWNFPLAMITRKVGPALAAGCTAVVKPSELTPFSALAVRELAVRAGVPEGAFQVVTSGDGESSKEVGLEMCENPIVKKISFTGSTPVGRILMKQSADTVKRLSLELGGNAPFIVFQDADIDQAVISAMSSKFRNAGQTCVCSDRFLIHKSVEDEFLSKLVQTVRGIPVGRGMDRETTMGPLISESAVTSVQEKIEEAIREGAECVFGGRRMGESLGPHFMEPCVMRNVSTESRLWNTETFGPVVPIRTFDTEDEAIRIANDDSTGLAGYAFTKDMERAFRVMGRMQNGLVGINEGVISTASAPFGGMKESGLGREGSSMGIEEYLETKYVFLNV